MRNFIYFVLEDNIGAGYKIKYVGKYDEITVNMGNNLGKSYSKHESQPRMFATDRPDLVVAGRRKKK